MKSIKVCALFVFVLLSHWAMAQPRNLIAYTDTLINRGEIAAVIPFLEEFLSKNPNNEDALRLLGFHHIDRGDLGLAETYYRRALVLNPKCARCYLNLGKLFAKRNDQKQALEYYQLAEDLDPQDALIYIQRAQLKMQIGDISAALLDLNKGMLLDPAEADYYLLLRAGLHYRLEDMDAACEDYHRAKTFFTQYSPQDSLLLAHIEASILDICVDTRPSYYYQRGIALYNVQDYSGAVKWYKQGLEKFPQDAMTLNFLGNAYLALMDYDIALTYYNAALREQEQLLATLQANPRFTAVGAAQDAKHVFKGTIAEIHLAVAECLLHQSDFEQALKRVNQAIQLMPEVMDFPKEKYYNMRGHIFLALQQQQLALADFNKSIASNKDFAPAYVNRAIAKVNAVQKAKTATYTVRGDFRRQPLRINWGWPSNLDTKAAHSAVISAWSDCNIAIDMDKDFGFAYYIRGQIKHMLADPSYCADLLLAQKLQIGVEEDLLQGCTVK